jgi:hypothetical protein
MFTDKSHVEGTQTYARYEFKELQEYTIINKKREPYIPLTITISSYI